MSVQYAKKQGRVLLPLAGEGGLAKRGRMRDAVRCALLASIFILATGNNAKALDSFVPWAAVISNAYGSCGGGREPIINIGAPGIVDMLKATPEGGIWSCEYGKSAAENASISVFESISVESGIMIPNKMRFVGLIEPAAIFQLDFARMWEIWIAKKSASGSPSVYRRLTDPGLVINTASNFDAMSGEIVRHATTAFIFSVSNRTLAASFSNSAALNIAFPAVSPALIPSFLASETCPSTVSLYASNSIFASKDSCFCNCTTAYVEMPTIAAATAAIPKNDNIILFQVSSDKPSIRLTPLEKLVLSVVAISCSTLLLVTFLSFRNIWRGRKY